MFPIVYQVTVLFQGKGYVKGIWKCPVEHHFLCDDTANKCLHHVVNGWLHMTYVLSFVEDDMFVGVICNNDV